MNNIFVSWKQKIESRIISDLKSQYTESEEQIRQRKEQFCIQNFRCFISHFR